MNMTDNKQLLTVSDLHEFVGISRQRMWKLRQKPDFPKPDMVLGSAQGWYAETIERWMSERRGRLD